MKQIKHRLNTVSVASFLLVPFLLTLVACDGNLKLPTFESNAPSKDTAPREAINEPNVKTPQPAEPSSTPAPKTPKPVTPNPNETQADSIKIYWLSSKDSDFTLSPSPLDIEDKDLSSQDKLSKALERLLKGPANSNVSSAIPETTKLYKVTVESDGVHVDLSKDFTSGGGSLSMQGRLGQVIYTASSLKPQTPIWISIEGEPLEVLGGEGLEIPQPITRKEFDSSFSI